MELRCWILSDRNGSNAIWHRAVWRCVSARCSRDTLRDSCRCRSQITVASVFFARPSPVTRGRSRSLSRLARPDDRSSRGAVGHVWRNILQCMDIRSRHGDAGGSGCSRSHSLTGCSEFVCGGATVRVGHHGYSCDTESRTARSAFGACSRGCGSADSGGGAVRDCVEFAGVAAGDCCESVDVRRSCDVARSAG